MKLFHSKNMGKGACIKSSLPYVSGEYVIIQDADLEYDPQDYNSMLEKFKNNDIDVVYGSRVLNKQRYSLKKSFPVNFRIFSNHLLTIFSNIMNYQNLTDAHTCYKMFKTEIIKNINPQENDFAFCPEVTTKIARMKYKIVEVPISYQGRGYDEGKKIGIYDAFRVLIVIFKHKFFK